MLNYQAQGLVSMVANTYEPLTLSIGTSIFFDRFYTVTVNSKSNKQIRLLRLLSK
jgi:hypothetical protein